MAGLLMVFQAPFNREKKQRQGNQSVESLDRFTPQRIGAVSRLGLNRYALAARSQNPLHSPRAMVADDWLFN